VITTIFIIVGLIALYMNIAATFHLFRCKLYERIQIIAQLFVIWLIPFIGAILILSVIFSSTPTKFEKLTKSSTESSALLSWFSLETFFHHTDYHGDGGGNDIDDDDSGSDGDSGNGGD